MGPVPSAKPTVVLVTGDNYAEVKREPGSQSPTTWGRQAVGRGKTGTAKDVTAPVLPYPSPSLASVMLCVPISLHWATWRGKGRSREVCPTYGQKAAFSLFTRGTRGEGKLWGRGLVPRPNSTPWLEEDKLDLGKVCPHSWKGREVPWQDLCRHLVATGARDTHGGPRGGTQSPEQVSRPPGASRVRDPRF